MNEAAAHWETFKAEFHKDGSLRDIYVFGTDLADWRRLAGFVMADEHAFRFSGGWSNGSFPEDIASLFPTSPESELTLLSIAVGGVTLNCHFFSQDDIELDLDPADIDDPAKLDAVFEFMSGLAQALGKDVFLTPEGMPEIRMFRLRHDADGVSYTPLGGFA